MSRIIFYLKCDHCGKEYDNLFISFGHPENDFVYEWKCEECGGINEYLVKALPY